MNSRHRRSISGSVVLAVAFATGCPVRTGPNGDAAADGPDHARADSVGEADVSEAAQIDDADEMREDADDPSWFTCIARRCAAGREMCLLSRNFECRPLDAACIYGGAPNQCVVEYACDRAANCAAGEVCCASYGPARTTPPTFDAGCPVVDGGMVVRVPPVWACYSGPREGQACTHGMACAAMPGPAAESQASCCTPGGWIAMTGAACAPAALCPRDALRCTTDADCPADAPHCRVVGTLDLGGDAHWFLHMCRP